MFDLKTAFFIPVWRRVAVSAVCLVWSAFEFISASPMWGLLFLGLGVYCVWQFFFDGWPEDENGR